MKKVKSISIVVADDHPAVLHGVTDILKSNVDMDVVAHCTDGAAALDAIRQFAPSLAVLDIFMPRMTGLDVLTHLSAEGSETKLVFLTATANDEQILAAIAGGAKGIMLK